MKIYKLPTLADASPNGEYRLGTEEAETGSLYLVYGRLRPGQLGHKLLISDGEEEIICVVKGTMTVKCGKKSFTVGAGEAFNPGAGAEVALDNSGDCEAIFIAARSAGCAPAQKAAPAKEAPAPIPSHEPREQNDAGERSIGAQESDFEITNDGVPLEE